MKLFLIYLEKMSPNKEAVLPIGIFSDEEEAKQFCKDYNQQQIDAAKEKAESYIQKELEDLQHYYSYWDDDFGCEVLSTDSGKIYIDEFEMEDYKQQLLSEKWYQHNVFGFLLSIRPASYKEFKLNTVLNPNQL